MQQKDSWLLPEGIEEVLPEDAKHLESLRRKILDMFACWGYELVIPPFIYYLDSLLTGWGHDLELQTFKLTDQISGEMLGVRADMTPQVARIDAHNLQHEWPTRLCYVGTILHTRGDPLEKTRSPMQIGAELYGHAGKESDVEVIRLIRRMVLAQYLGARVPAPESGGRRSGDLTIREIPPPQAWVGRSVQEVDPYGRHGVFVLAIRRGTDGSGGEIFPVPPELRLEGEDGVVLLGPAAGLDRLAPEA